MKQNLIRLDTCPICGHQNHKAYLTVKDHSTSQELFSIVECSECHFLFTNPRPSDDSISEYYKSDKYISHTNQKTGWFARVYQVMRKEALKGKYKWISKHIKAGHLLDYGSGTGEFLDFMKNKSWQVKGIEIAEGPRSQSIKNYNLEVLAPTELENFKPNTFDVITLWHVLEHVGNLNETLEELVLKLKRNGILVLALPNPESWDAKQYKDYWAAWDVPIHFYHFKKSDIKRIAEKIGLELIEIINMPFDAYYISLLSEEYKTGKKNWSKALLNGMISNKNASTDNASSLTYILRKL